MLWWVLAHLVVGAAVSAVAYLVLGASDPSGASVGTWIFRLPAVVAIAGGVGLGFAQWLVLRRYLVDLEFADWAKVTALAWLLAGILFFCQFLVLGADKYSSVEGVTGAGLDTLSRYSMPRAGLGLVIGGLLGTVVGFSQWFIFESYFRRAALWVPANIASYALAGAASAFLAVLLDALAYTNRGVDDNPAEYAPLQETAVAVGQGAFFVVSGVLTGLMLVRLLRLPRLHNTRETPHTDPNAPPKRRVLS